MIVKRTLYRFGTTRARAVTANTSTLIRSSEALTAQQPTIESPARSLPDAPQQVVTERHGMHLQKNARCCKH